jgi:hypothetical protein
VTIATTTVRLAHRVRLRHAATGEVIEPVSARGVLPYGWAMRVRGGEVVVTTRDGAPVPPAAPVITVAISDLRLAALVQTPTVDVTLGAADITVDVDPVPMALDVELSTPGTGAPGTGRTVTARATSGPTPLPTIPLPESDPGVYGSGPVVWTAAFTPLDLLVDGDLLRQLAVDHTRSSTRIRLVDTT